MDFSKGKAGVPVELGLRVCIMEDRHGFILHRQVMQNTTDGNVAVPMIAATKALPSFNARSFDKCFHSLGNQKELQNHLDQVVLPKKASYPKSIRNANTHRSLCKRKGNIQPLNRPLMRL